MDLIKYDSHFSNNFFYIGELFLAENVYETVNERLLRVDKSFEKDE